MKILLLAINITLFLSQSLLAQDQIFTYTEKDDKVILTRDAITMTLGPSRKTKAGTVDRLVRINGRRYTFSMKETEVGKKKQEIKDSVGTVLATVLLYKGNRYNVQLANGDFLKWAPKSKKHWSYQKNGKDVISGEYQKVHGIKQIKLQNMEFTEPSDEIIQIIFLERTSHIVHSMYPVGLIIGVGVVLAIMRTASGSQ